MRLLLIGNHTCGNRGDSAILRGLIHSIESQCPDTDITITSRYPVSASYLIGRPVQPDPFERWHRRPAAGLVSKMKVRLTRRMVPTLMMLALRTGWSGFMSMLPKFLRREIDVLARYDAVIQVGGSFFVDLYGPGQFEYPFAALLARRPLYLIGHSMGPFERRFSRQLAHTLLSQAKQVMLRESVSRELIERMGLPTQRLIDGADCAWAVPPTIDSRPTLRWLAERPEQRPLVAVTMRELAPFDRRLGTTQDAYEAAFSRFVDSLIEAGYDVIAASTCTGIDSYHRDDRMNALRMVSRLKHPLHIHVAMDEFDDVGLGELFARCDLVVGTRLHSAILAMNFGTPAIAINYEHKSEGIMLRLGLPPLSQPVQALLDGTLTTHALTLLGSLDEWREKVAAAVKRERERATAMVAVCLSSISAGA